MVGYDFFEEQSKKIDSLTDQLKHQKETVSQKSLMVKQLNDRLDEFQVKLDQTMDYFWQKEEDIEVLKKEKEQLTAQFQSRSNNVFETGDEQELVN